jgi:ATP-binding cassette subfamily B protein
MKFSQLKNFSKYYLLPLKKYIIIALIALALTSACLLAIGKVLDYLIDSGISSGNFHDLYLGVSYLFAIGLLFSVVSFLRSYFTRIVCEQVITRVRRDMYANLLDVSMSFFDRMPVSDVITRISSDSYIVSEIMTNELTAIIRNFFIVVGGIVFMFFTSPKLTLITFLTFPAIIIFLINLSYKLRNISYKSQGQMDSVNSQIEDSLCSLRLIKADNLQNYYYKSLETMLEEYLSLTQARFFWRSLLISLVILFLFAAVSAILIFASYDLIAGRITSGALAAFLYYTIMTASSISKLSHTLSELQRAAASASRIYELFDSNLKGHYSGIEKLDPNSAGTIRFENIHFSYKNRRQSKVFNGLDLVISPGEKIAITGFSGEGKSTIFNLLLRLYPYDSGSIFLDDKLLESIEISNLREIFSYASQDSIILSTTIRQNLIFTEADTTRQQLEEVTKGVGIYEFISSLPEGFDNHVGRRGSYLSGGQKQRICIARALLRDSPILLLDEITTALSVDNIKQIIDYIKSNYRDKTVIFTSHDENILAAADKVVFLQNGRVSDIGTHQQLLKTNSLYGYLRT